MKTHLGFVNTSIPLGFPHDVIIHQGAAVERAQKTADKGRNGQVADADGAKVIWVFGKEIGLSNGEDAESRQGESVLQCREHDGWEGKEDGVWLVEVMPEGECRFARFGVQREALPVRLHRNSVVNFDSATHLRVVRCLVRGGYFVPISEAFRAIRVFRAFGIRVWNRIRFYNSCYSLQTEFRLFEKEDEEDGQDAGKNCAPPV